MNARHVIDRAWCDIGGVYLEGWAHCGAQAFEAVDLCCAGRAVRLPLADRPDVRAAFPEVPAAQATGFRGYLACPPFQPVTLRLHAGGAMVETAVVVGPECGPPPIPDVEGEAPIARFTATMKARRGTVLEIGARVVGSHSSLNAAQFLPECRFVGCDIHPAPGVDLVADAHALSRSVPPGTIDGVFSLAVLEHVAAPWVVAAEINRVLRLGGETLHVVPHAWPVHEQPNDFWRFSEAGLQVLFGAATGFEVLEAGMACPVQIVPTAAARFGDFVRLPLSFAYGAAYVHARKVAEIADGVVGWPLGAIEAQSRAYPAHA